MEKLYSAGEAAKYLKISHAMALRHLRLGRIEARKVGVDGRYVIEQSALDDFQAGRTFRRHRNRKFMPQFAVDTSDVQAILAGEPAPSSAELASTLDETLAILESASP